MDIIVTETGPIIAGPDAISVAIHSDSGAVREGLRFQPGILPQLLRTPACDLAGMRVPLTDVIGRRIPARTLADPESIAAALGQGLEFDARPVAIAAELAAGRTVTQIAAEFGITARTVHRIAFRYYGYGPKTLTRILRMQRALVEIRSGTALSAAAAVAGYADQSHLSREMRALTGIAPGKLIATN